MFPFELTRNTRQKDTVPVFATNGMVATSQYLAAQAGLSMLQKGGNAIDAAVAAAIALTVVEPTSNGIGGDAFAIVLHEEKLYGLNSSGYAPASMNADLFLNRNLTGIPPFGAAAITVPGAPYAWKSLHERFGTLPFGDLFVPAIQYASDGYPVSVLTSRSWASAYALYASLSLNDDYSEWFKTFCPAGRAPLAGEIWASDNHAKTLKELADTSVSTFYTGNLSKKISQCVREHDGFLQESDLYLFQPEWVEPIKTDFRDYTIWELPPNGQGFIALLATAILNRLPLENYTPAQRLHASIESTKLAFRTGLEILGEPKTMKVDILSYLDDIFLEEEAAKISDHSVIEGPLHSKPGGTVYLCTADKEGNMVSYIQSNYQGFGSGIVVPGTGIALHNRGRNFNLQKGHPNCLRGRSRPYHTIIPGFLSQGDRWIGPFGVMGGFMQPQGHLQVLVRMLLEKTNPQESLNYPRWQWIDGKTVCVEDTFDRELLQELSLRGHHIETKPVSGFFGRGQVIWSEPFEQKGKGARIYCGGTDGRADGCVIGI
jgi:gamma-glutamyltranspeptidase/glutathione hydrolase